MTVTSLRCFVSTSISLHWLSVLPQSSCPAVMESAAGSSSASRKPDVLVSGSEGPLGQAALGRVQPAEAYTWPVIGM